MTSSSSADNKVMRSSSPCGGHNNNHGEETLHSFDCAICYQSLTKRGPPLECFTFGKLLINLEQLPFLERDHIYREFQLYDQCFANGRFDCDKVLSTVCGHIFHSGCIREWFFMQRLDMNPKCPFCKKLTRYEECRILHPVLCSLPEDTDEEDEQNKEEDADAPLSLNETEYSEISCTSSSWPSDASDEENNDRDAVELPEDKNEADGDEDEDLFLYDGDEEGQEDLVDQDDEDETESQRVPPISNGDDDTFYFPMFIIPRDREIDVARKKMPGQMSKMLRTVGTFNLTHMFTLLMVIKTCCNMFQVRKEKFVDDMEMTTDKMEDENLADIDHETLVPLGYHFLLCCILFGLFIWSGEVVIAAVFKAKMKGKSEKNVTKFTFVCALLSFLTSGYLLCLGAEPTTQRK